MTWDNLPNVIREQITGYLDTQDRLNVLAADGRHDSEWAVSARLRPIIERLNTRALQLTSEVNAYRTATDPVIAVQNHPSRNTFLTVADSIDASITNFVNQSMQAALLLQTLLGPHPITTPTLHGLNIQLQGLQNGIGTQRNRLQARRTDVFNAFDVDPMMFL